MSSQQNLEDLGKLYTLKNIKIWNLLVSVKNKLKIGMVEKL
ncbi:MAG: hypothetical protein AAB626_03105 [Patescibacteria group bacterium]